MFRKNDQHLQQPLLSDLDALPAKLKKRLEASWAGTFYREVFVRLDESPFAGLYSAEASRPNIPINVLVGLETLKALQETGHILKNRELPVIFMTGYADPECEKKASKMKLLGYLHKPFDDSQILHLLKIHLGQPYRNE